MFVLKSSAQQRHVGIKLLVVEHALHLLSILSHSLVNQVTALRTSLRSNRLHLVGEGVLNCLDSFHLPFVQVEHDGKVYYGFSANTDIVAASVEAYIDCINKFVS